MSAVVKLGTGMPGDFEMNGVDALRDDLVDDPKTLRMAVVWFDVKEVKVDTDSGDHVPTIRVRRIEPLGNADDVTTTVKDEVGKAIEKRTGRTPVPFDIVELTETMTLDEA